ncbi:hypothetical protein DPMN_165354 [Dreissena polymorpha]|uniref:E3 ubiquitin-protein ligase n=2 Tax=Dreissena polymorpha TaxID=45954 RepID=A0A9D4IWB2_DREPO|nr:hypothetical protein DPMN_165354 [Dreissena polymorpha]
MIFGEGIQMVLEDDQTYSLHGNWFQLEWAWHYIDCFMQQQEIIQHTISSQTQQYAGTPHEVDRSERSKHASLNRSHEARSPPFDTGRQGDLGADGYVSQSRTGTRDPVSDYGAEMHPSRSRLREDDEDNFHTSRSRHRDERSGARSQAQDYGADANLLLSGATRDEAAGNESAHLDHSISLDSESSGGSGTRGTGTRGRDTRETGQRDQSPHSASGHRSPQAGYDDNDPETSDQEMRRKQMYVVEHQLGKSSPSSDREGRFDASVLAGKGFSIPPDTMTSLSPMQLARSDDQNQTFQKFSSLGLGDDRRQASKNFKAPINDDYLSLSRRSQHEHDHSAAINLCVSPRATSPVDTSSHSGAKSLHHDLPSVKNIPDHYTEDQLLASFSINGLQIVLYYGDLREETSDAIVNPANESLEHWGGLAYLLSKARGREMDEECRRFIRTNGKLKTTEVMHTSGGGALHTSNIIHAAGPMWISASFREKFMRQLTQTFLNCFTYANNRLWIKSLALPTISTGVYGAPLDICVRCFLYAALLFTNSNPESERRLADVRLVNNDAESTVTSIVLVQTMLESSISELTAEAENIMATPADDRFSFLETKTRSSDLGSSLRLPRGRPESRPFTSPTDEGKESTSSLSRRRSSSLSLSTSNKNPASSDTGVLKSAGARPQFDTNHIGTTTKPRSASGVPKSEKLAAGFSQTFSPSSASTMSKALASTSGTRTAPKIKSQLFPETKLHQKDTKPTYSEHSAGTFDMKRVRPAFSSPQPQGDSDNDSDDRGNGLRSLPADLSGATNYRTKFLEGEKKVHICAICLDDVRDPHVLKCKHEFCRSCIESHFKTKPSCPMCGSIYGKIVGNQPIGGTMTMYTVRDQCIAGYEKEDGMIVITYKFPDGMQDATHPHPGRSYKGIKRTCYLPNSAEGREVKRLLKKAFDARLLFTVGDSRTSGKTDVLTWNDVHHKTSIDGGPTKFGYPDPKYLKRVKEELAAKGITSA